MQLRFDFVHLEPDAEGYTVLISERDAEMLGSSTESTVSVVSSERNRFQVQTFSASNFIDEFEGDDVRPDAPCLQDAILLREPSGDVRELHAASDCVLPSWSSGERDVVPPDN